MKKECEDVELLAAYELSYLSALERFNKSIMYHHAFFA
jgi:hypothetical protein